MTAVLVVDDQVNCLDLNLPDIGGMRVLRRIRGWSSVPIIVLSAHSAQVPEVAALGRWRRRLRDQAVRLTRTEWRIVSCLARRPGRLITQGQLLDEVWRLPDVDSGNRVRVFMGSEPGLPP